MNIKLGALPLILQVLQGISTQKTSAVFAFRLSKSIGKITDEVKGFEAARIKLCEIYADKDADGKPVIASNQYVGVEGNAEFVNELSTLANEDIELDIKPLNISQLELECIKLSAQDISALGEFLEVSDAD